MRRVLAGVEFLAAGHHDAVMNSKGTDKPLRYGWTTGACATAAAKAACAALLGGDFPDPVQIRLPRGQTPEFALKVKEKGKGWARAGIVKDAGDDPDVTHGALIISRVSFGVAGSGVTFRAGEGVGHVTLPGLTLGVGEPAINPAPRRMMVAALHEVAAAHGAARDFVVEVSIPAGKKIARKTLNARLGILGGLSILGTTGIVTPYSCSAWIHSIHSGVDVARALKLPVLAACVGSTSEKAVKTLYDLPDTGLVEMGNFVGGVLKYVRQNPVPKLVVAGGFGKICKLAQGEMDLHSGRCRVDHEYLARLLEALGADAKSVARARAANTALEVLQIARKESLDLAAVVASHACDVCRNTLKGADMALEVVICDREGAVIGRAP
jgi:cobalt-precorrin-5B (C1)-methyltransferase